MFAITDEAGAVRFGRVFFAYRYPATSTYRIGIGVLAACSLVPALLAVAAFTSRRSGTMIGIGAAFAGVTVVCWLLCARWWRAIDRRASGAYGITLSGDHVRSVDWDITSDRVVDLAIADVERAVPRQYRGRSLIEITTRSGRKLWLPGGQLAADHEATVLSMLSPPLPSAEQLEHVVVLRGALREVFSVDITDGWTQRARADAGGIHWTFRFGTDPAIELEPGRGGSAGYAAATDSLDIYRVLGLVEGGRPIDLAFVDERDAIAGDVSYWDSSVVAADVLAHLRSLTPRR